ncbi:MAG: hypothetical protein AB1894_24975 [Chloroflexota bacterium]
MTYSQSLPGKESETSTASRRKAPRKASVTLVGLLLLLQAFFLFAIFPTLVVINFVQRPEAHLVMFIQDGKFILPRVEVESTQTLDILFYFPDATIAIPGRIVTAIPFSWLAPAVLLVSLFFLGTWRPAWALALLLQVALMVLSLAIYFYFRHPYVYLVMAYSIFMVFYLNHYEIQVAFQSLRTE